MSLVVALDTMAWIWALKPADQAANATERDYCERAAGLFAWLDDKQADIVVPAVCVAELLTPLGEREQNRLLATLSARCRPAVFDLRTAAMAATLFRQAAAQRKPAAKSSKSKGKSAPKATPRHVLRADTLIVASARAAGATHFITEDAGCRKVAELAGLIALGLDDDPGFALPIQRDSV